MAVTSLDSMAADPVAPADGETASAPSTRAFTEESLLAEIEARAPMSAELPERLVRTRRLRLRPVARHALWEEWWRMLRDWEGRPDGRWFEELVSAARRIEAEIAWEELLEHVRTKKRAPAEGLIEVIVGCIPEGEWCDIVTWSLRQAFIELRHCDEVLHVSTIRVRTNERLAKYVGPVGIDLLRALAREYRPQHAAAAVKPRRLAGHASVPGILAEAPDARAAVLASARLMDALERSRFA